jgi:MGT family glycosyltransferase
VAKIGVVNVPFYSHVAAASRLSAVLVEQGHEVISWGAERFRPTIEDAGAEFRLHTPEMPLAANSFIVFVSCLADMLEEHTEDLIDQLFREGVELLIHDSQVPWARIAGEYLGLPRLITHPMYPIADSHRIPSADDPEGVTIDPDEAFRRVEACWHRVGRRWGVELGTWNTMVHSSSVREDTVLAFTTEDVIGAGVLDEHWRFIGPLLKDIPPQPRNGERPLVYACFGTSFNRRREQFATIIEGLADLPVDAVISMGKGPMGYGRIGQADFEPLPANVELVDYADGREMLSRAAIHITHAGCNSAHESLLAGVPMLCLPQAYDQFPLAGRIASLGAGTVLDERWESVRQGAEWILEDEQPTRRARELRDSLLQFDGAGSVASLIKEALDH